MIELSVLDQLPSLAAYTVISLLWHIDDGARKDVVSALEKASLTLTKSFPILAGQVVKSTEKPNSSAYHRVVDYEPHNGKPPVVVKDCTNLLPSYEELRKARAPMSMLDGSIVSPMKGLPHYYDGSEPTPVFILQANFVTGGLVLTSACMHNALDMNGMGQVIRLLAQALRGEAFTPDQLRDGNMDRTTAIPFLKPSQELLAHENCRCPSSLSNPAFGGGPIAAPWKLFNFPAQVLAKLKEEASKSDAIGPGKSIPFLSTNDALTAFVWQRNVVARLSTRLAHDNNAEATESSVVRALNARSALSPPLPPGYLGHCVACLTTKLPLHDIATAPLSTLAVALRHTRAAELDDHYVRSLASLLRSLDDKTTFSYGAKFNPDTDLMASSWAELGLYQLDFGPVLGGGRGPEFVRRPLFAEMQGLVYYMPRTGDGSIAVAISMREDDARALMEDGVWKGVVEVID